MPNRSLSDNLLYTYRQYHWKGNWGVYLLMSMCMFLDMVTLGLLWGLARVEGKTLWAILGSNPGPSAFLGAFMLLCNLLLGYKALEFIMLQVKLYPEVLVVCFGVGEGFWWGGSYQFRVSDIEWIRPTPVKITRRLGRPVETSQHLLLAASFRPNAPAIEFKMKEGEQRIRIGTQAPAELIRVLSDATRRL